MKRVRLDRWASQIQPPRNPRLPRSALLLPDAPEPPSLTLPTQSHASWHLRRGNTLQRRAVTTSTSPQSSPGAFFAPDEGFGSGEAFKKGARYRQGMPAQEGTLTRKPNSPTHKKAAKSAKLAALHARLSLPSKLPLEVLARCLIDPTVDDRPGYSNAPLALLGQDLLGYYTAEYLMCRYPRLPMSIIFAAQYAYNGPATLAALRAEWGVEVVAAPGAEVDPGLLQLKRVPAGNAMDAEENVRIKDKHLAVRVGEGRRNSQLSFPKRIVFDDEFGDLHSRAPVRSTQAAKNTAEQEGEAIDADAPEQSEIQPTDLDLEPHDLPNEGTTVQDASTSFVRALTGALHIFGGDATTKAFHRAHILSRHVDLQKLFHFTHPTRDLSRLCAREDLQPPVARLLSETGRLSRTPVFIVGVFSGESKVGEGAGSSLNEARVRAAAAALRAWYLYSPPENQVVFPSDVEGEGAKNKKWKPQMIDVGEVIA